MNINYYLSIHSVMIEDCMTAIMNGGYQVLNTLLKYVCVLS